jgi:hypothetical protein
MATHDYVISNASGAAVRADLNNALAAIVSNNSSATAPTTTYAYQWWADTTAGVLKIRNSANSAWITLFQLDGEFTAIPLENGTAAAPSLYFKDSGTDTGLYSPGTDQVAISTGGTGRLFVDSSGRVGIGTVSPLSVLDVKTASDKHIIFTPSATYAGNAIYASTDAGAQTALGIAGKPLQFFVDSTERARIDSSGNALVNTTTAGGKFNVFQDASAGSPAIYALRNEIGGTTNIGEFYDGSSGGTLRFGFRCNGGLANYSANNVNLSDINTKKDIAPAAGTWDCLKEWEIVKFRYKDQPDNADLNMGVIAQQVAESCPEVITVFQEAKEAKEAVLDEEGNELEPAQEAQPEKLGVKDQQMMWMAIKALQEAQLRIEELEAKVAALEAA